MSNQPKWAAQKKYPEICNKIRQALHDVKDPELSMDIIQLGLIRDVIINNNQISVKMILTTPFCPFGPSMLDLARTKTEEATGIPTLIEMTDEIWNMSMMENGLQDNWGLYK